MEHHEQDRQPGRGSLELCQSLRWKSYYGQDWEDEEHLLAVLMRNEVPYSCLKTCRSWGPDDDIAAPERCTSNRPCFEASPLFPSQDV